MQAGVPGMRRKWSLVRQKSVRDLTTMHRRLRLKKKPSQFCKGFWIDVALAVVVPSTLGIVFTLVSVLIIQYVDGSAEWVSENLYSPQVTTTLGTFLSFLVALRLEHNLKRNADLINHFNDLCGACVNMAVWSRSLVSSGKLTYLTLDEDATTTRTYQQTDVGLILASVPYIVKFTYRKIEIRHDELPIGSNAVLLGRMRELVNPKDDLVAVSPFLASVMMLGELFDGFEDQRLIKAPELSSLLVQLNALTAHEGAIAGSSSYQPPFLLDGLLYVVFVLYYALMIFVEITPSTEWQSLWIVAVLIVANFGVFSISNRYANPFLVRTGRTTQKTFISDAARQAERAIEGVFARRTRIADMTNLDTTFAPLPVKRGVSSMFRV